MPIETFSWRPQAGPIGAIKLRTLKARFGDGYTQEAADGINANEQTWPLEFLFKKAEIQSIKAFLDAHAGYRAFLWTPPFGGPAQFRAGEYTLTDLTAGLWQLSVTFTQTHKP